MYLGKLNIRVTVNRYESSAIDEYGSPAITIAETWSKWASVEDKRGGHDVNKGTEQWDYDYKITMRFEKSRQLLDTDKLVYNGKTLQINSIKIIEESYKQFEVVKCSVTSM